MTKLDDKNDTSSQLLREHDVYLLHVMPGLKCNLSCVHCCNDSGPTATVQMSEEELENVKECVNRHSPKNLLFTGGEPTLHVRMINQIISSHSNWENLAVQITTNGWYAKGGEKLITKTLKQIVKLDHLQLSYDVFHGSILTFDDVKELINYCSAKKIGFNISVCISSPLELEEALKIKRGTGATVIFQTVDASGRAKTNKKNYVYPFFEKDVLRKKCPNVGQISYICGRGYSTCCSNLMFNQILPNIAHPNIEDHLGSTFYKNMKNKTFGELLEENNISVDSLSPEHSSPCGLCEYIHTKVKIKNGFNK